jgi:hypothetical protein
MHDDGEAHERGEGGDWIALGMRCGDTETDLHLQVEGELHPIRGLRLEAHLAACEGCRRRREELREERLWVAEVALEAPALSSRFAPKIIARLRREQERKSALARRGALLRRALAAAGGLAALGSAATLFFAVLNGPVEEPYPRGEPLASRDAAGPAEEVFIEPLSEALAWIPAAEHALDPAAREADQEWLEGADCDLAEWLSDVEISVPAPAPSFRPEPAVLASRKLEADRRPRRSAPMPPSTPTAATPRIHNFAQVLGITAQVGAGLGDEEPCPPDPNRDGKTDFVDVALYCQYLMHHVILPEKPAFLGEPVEEEFCDQVCADV